MSRPKRKSERRSFCVRFPKSSPRRPLGLKRATLGAMRGAASLLRQRSLRHRHDPGDALNGEIYDMYKLTAAHRTLPFETMVRVTNLNNGKSTVVRITDRGPFVDNRIIDLSLAAAREVDSVDAGVVPVRVEVLGGVDPTAGFFTVQVGAFRDRSNAERLRDRLNASYSPIFIQQYDSPDGIFYRVRVGKISGEDAAQQFAEQLRDREGFTPMVLRLDEGTPAGGTQ